ncbi:MAG TPA: hypothetical protein VGH89_27155 [Pseudonocardia sp.]|jgi:hypothetical protein
MTVGTSNAATEAPSSTPRSVTWPAFRVTRRFAGLFVLLNVANLVAILLLQIYQPDVVNPTVWNRASIILVSSLLTLLYVARASRGSVRAYSRLRVASACTLIAVVVIVALPGLLPGWMKVEQAVCGLLLLGVVAAVNSTKIRSLYAAT